MYVRHTPSHSHHVKMSPRGPLKTVFLFAIEKCAVVFGNWKVCSRVWQLKSVQLCLAIEKMCSRVWQLKSVQSCLAIEKCAVVFGSWKVCSCVGQLKSVLSCLAIEKCAVVFCNWKVCSRVWQLKSAQSCLAIEECADVFGNWKVCRRVWQLKSVKTCFANLFFEVSKCTCNASKQLTILFLPLCRCVFLISPPPPPRLSDLSQLLIPSHSIRSSSDAHEPRSISAS